MKNYISKVINHQNLTKNEIESVMKCIISGEADKGEVAQFLLALRDKGETVDEITGAAQIMRNFVVPISSKHKNILDTCGTGGDKKGTFNISTIAALVVAGTGVIVAKHGNRSVSSQCGSACVLEALGVNLDIEKEHLTECLDQIGIVFLFAQKLHPAMKNVVPIRKELGVETIFNILGPLTNPASATQQVVGVYSRDLVEPIAYVLRNLGIKRALVVHGEDGLDEITTTGKTFVSQLQDFEILSYDIVPEELGIPRSSESDLLGGDLKENVVIVNDILSGQLGSKRNIVVLNAAYALFTAEKVDNIEDGISLAEQSIDRGRAKAKLEELKEFTQREI